MANFKEWIKNKLDSYADDAKVREAVRRAEREAEAKARIKYAEQIAEKKIKEEIEKDTQHYKDGFLWEKRRARDEFNKLF